ncbi:glycosyltransferase involved in cell wall biosynthesis [Polaribacter sp. Hel1_33_96]|jgi:glycosyltransferase involved in cell wall biosynthesis|uniref:glycosyltransferase n=1 Tax=Polaribacter sp. Hel1_33_96 TaxID=1336805 RepID=UPI000C713E30|nr:glycosyltransferase [Polaribacter sp. Hel1_33_96]PKV64271.1 glycosyltransferase involved in cell wall biosynthesis [Polaribacter sp. Hel1_33_96]
MIKGKDIIVVGIQAWDIEIGSNCKNIAVEMSHHNRVLYINSPLDRITKFKERHTEKVKKRLRIKSGEVSDLETIETNLWTLYPKRTIESINWIKSKRIFDSVNRMNAKKFTKDIKSAIDRLEFKDYIIFNDSSMFLGQYLKELLRPKLYVYYMRDYLTKNPYWKKHGVRLEPKLIKNADLVVNNSTLYAEYGAKFNKHSYMVGQGCDTSLFNDLERDITASKDFENIPKPIIGYVGFLSSRRLSIEIIEHMAAAKPEWSIVLVGPEDDNFKASNLHNLTNVHFLGSRDSSELPNYIKGFDVAMNPQLINDATIGNYPRKIDEYLAMGKPTLASATKAMDYFKDYTYLGVTKEDYVILAEKALKENNTELEMKRRAYGTSHSWVNNVKEVYKYLLLVAEEKGIKI